MARPPRRGFFGRLLDRVQFALDYPKRLRLRRRQQEQFQRQVYGNRQPGWFRRLLAPLLYVLDYPRRSLNQFRAHREAQRLMDSFRVQPKVLRRSIWVFVGAIPAVVAVVCIGYYLFVVVPSSQAGVQDRYERWANEASDSNDRRARVCLQRLARESPTDVRRFKLVTLHLKNEDKAARERGMEMLAQMAPLEKAGYLPAHRRMADLLVDSLRGLTDPAVRAATLAEAEKHLTWCLDDSQLKNFAHYQLGQVYIAFGELAKAEQHLNIALAQYPEALLQLALVYDMQKKQERAEQSRRLFVDQARLRLRQNPDLDLLRLQAAGALAELREFSQAISLIDERPGLLQNLGVRALYAQFLARSAIAESTKDPATAMRLVQQGLQIDPKNGDLYKVLVEIAEGSKPGSAEATKKLEDLLAQGGPLSDYLHFLVASNSALSQNYEKALRHYEIVFSRNPNAFVIANNLACVLLYRDDPQLDRALDLANKAILEAERKNAKAELSNIRETRGQIYVKKKMWSEAVIDLEFALQSMQGREKIHRGLAEAYDGLGDKGLAERHRELAKQLATKGFKEKK